MKHLNKLITASLVVCAMAILASCSQEADPATAQEEQDVLITIGASSRVDQAPNDDIGTLRMLGFKASNGQLAFNKLIVENPYSVLNEYKVEVKTGEFTFVFIANEHTDDDLKAILANDSKVASIYKLKQLVFGKSAFIGVDMYIPMVSFYEKVKVKGDYELVYDGQTYKDENVWPVKLNRLGAKVRLHLLVANDDPLASGNINYYFNNIPTQVFLEKNVDNSAFLEDGYLYDTNNPYKGELQKKTESEITLQDENKTTVSIPAGHAYYGIGSVILPESYFTPAANENKGIELIVQSPDGANQRIGKITIDTDNYTLPRNTFVEVIATAKNNAQELEFTVKVVDWKDIEVDTDLY